MELDDLSGQLVDPSRDGGVTVKQFVLDLVDVVLQPRDNRCVFVDGLVEDGVENRFGSEPQRVGIPL